MVRALGAVQAQDYAGAKWALSLRGQTVAEADIEGELSEGSILRTHVLRPTWHFVAPEDIRWMLALTAARINQVMGYYNGKLGLTPAVFRRSSDAIAKALSGGRSLTRGELKVRIEQARIGPLDGQRLARLMMRAEQDALICSGPRRGAQFTYALLDERAPPTPPRDRDDALATLARRYFRTRGPATIRDFAWWSGLTMTDSARAVQILGRALRTIALDGSAYVIAADAPPLPRPVRSAHLLPNYDEYFIGFRDRSAIAGRIGSLERVIGGSALIGHVVVLDGQLIGGWRRVAGPGRSGVTIELELPPTLTPSERRRVIQATARMGGFFGRKATGTGPSTPVSHGAHRSKRSPRPPQPDRMTFL